MSPFRRVAIALSALLGAAMAAAAACLWPLVSGADVAYIEYVQRGVPFGWLLLQAATPLFALCVLTALGGAALAWRLARAASD